MTRWRLTGAAEDDLTATYLQGFDQFGQAQADRYFSDLEAAFEMLADHPRMARLRMEFSPPVRIHRCGVHMIVYDDTPDGVLILRIRHGREDWADA